MLYLLQNLNRFWKYFYEFYKEIIDRERNKKRNERLKKSKSLIDANI